MSRSEAAAAFFSSHRLPIILSPMANAGGVALAKAVAKCGVVPSLPAASWSLDMVVEAVRECRTLSRTCNGIDTADASCTNKKQRGACCGEPIVNFFAHHMPDRCDEEDWKWLQALRPLLASRGLSIEVNTGHAGPPAFPPWYRRSVGRQSFDLKALELVRELQLKCVSFHFGLPATQRIDSRRMVSLIRDASHGIAILSTATSIEEANWLVDHGVDGVILQGLEAGGHQGSFLQQRGVCTATDLLKSAVCEGLHKKTMLIAAGGICSASQVRSVLQIGASHVQCGTAFLNTHESSISPIYRRCLVDSDHMIRGSLPDDQNHVTTMTRAFTGRFARALRNDATAFCSDYVCDEAIPRFPNAVDAWAEVRRHEESMGSWALTPMLCGTAVGNAAGPPVAASDVVAALSLGIE